MHYLYFGNGVRNSRRNRADYRNGVCTYREACFFKKNLSYYFGMNVS